MKAFMLLISLIVAMPVYSMTIEEARTEKVAKQFCSTNKECNDMIAMELSSQLFQGQNDSRDRSVTIGTHINRKSKQLQSYCVHIPEDNKKLCEQYKNALLLKYINGLLEQ